MGGVGLLAGIGWDPEIRGFLTVALAGALLVGTVWLLLITNTGIRLGSLIALAGLFGWFTIMAFVWWLQGIGYTGDSPVWEYEAAFADQAGAEAAGIEEAYVEFVGDLPDPNCDNSVIFPPAKTGWEFEEPAAGCMPRAVSLLMEYPGSDRVALLEEMASVDAGEIRTTLSERNKLLGMDDPRRRNEDQLSEAVASEVARREARIDKMSLSALAAAAPQVIEWAEDEGYLELGGWDLLSTAESGEATASAGAFIEERGVFAEVPTTVITPDGEAPSATPAYVFVDAFGRGGKPLPANDGTWARVGNKIANSARLNHPAQYAVVQARPAIPKAQLLGEAPPSAELDYEAETVSIVMIRNLGNLRLVPALVAIGSAIIFTALILSLHWRDLRVRREREAYEAVPA